MWRMAEVHQFAYGWAGPVLAYVMSVPGCLLGLLLATKARRLTGRDRIRLLVYAALAIGGTGIWLLHFIAMLGFEVVDSDLRYGAGMSLASFGIAVGIVAAGLFLASYGRTGPIRLISAGTLIGLGTASMHYTGMAAVRVGGSISHDPVLFALSVAISVTIATAALWSSFAVTGLRGAWLSAMVLTGGIWGMHYTAMAGVQVWLGAPPGGHASHPGSSTAITGLTAVSLVAPIIMLGGASVAMLAFFTIGNSTMDEVRSIYRTGLPEDGTAAARRIIDEVTARVTSEQPVSTVVLAVDVRAAAHGWPAHDLPPAGPAGPPR